MKLEKINDNQIRCTLTKEDLATRHLKLSELAYGTEKAKSLFRDMMQQASYEFGFEANDIPLMIEAIPLSSESIILIITKVEDPEELDTRFAKFAPSSGNPSLQSEDTPISSTLEGADDILDLFNKIREARKKIIEKNGSGNSKKQGASEQKTQDISFNLTKLYKFDDLDTVIEIAAILSPLYHGDNSLYKESGSHQYHLLVSKSDHTPEEFNKICNILSEYGTSHKFSTGMDAFYEEHMEHILTEQALQQLAQLV